MTKVKKVVITKSNKAGELESEEALMVVPEALVELIATQPGVRPLSSPSTMGGGSFELTGASVGHNNTMVCEKIGARRGMPRVNLVLRQSS